MILVPAILIGTNTGNNKYNYLKKKKNYNFIILK